MCLDNTLSDRLPDWNVETLDTTVAKAEAAVLVEALTNRLAVANLEKRACILANLKRKELVDTLPVRLAEV